MVDDGTSAAQVKAKHSINGSWMADAFRATAVLAVMKRAVARRSPREGRQKRATGRHAAPVRNHSALGRDVPSRHRAG